MADVEKVENILDLSRQGLKKLTKAQPQEVQGVTTLILDNNELQRWDNIDCYSSLRKLSACHNQLLRMYGVSRLHHLCTLNLSHNSILTIEGLKELVHLKWLCLASNNIKTIEHLHTNTHLEHLDLSENSITHVADISFLKNLKQLLLHGNRISQLRQCERYLPSSLSTLTLASNNVGDLNDMAHLVHLTNLREFSVAGNPCVNMTGNSIGFDYRPFVINWCMSLKVIDGFVVDAIESLKAEWLYSQGRGRQFRAGEQQALAQYLAGVCPLSGDALQSEEERKLRLILSKAQQHQQALREQVTSNGTTRGRGQVLNRSHSSPAPSPAARRRVGSFRNTSRSNGREVKQIAENVPSPDLMVASCQGTVGTVDPEHPEQREIPQLMSQSLDPSLLFSTGNLSKDSSGSEQNSAPANPSLEDSSSSEVNSGSNCPLQAATKLVPVPESLMSPDYRPVNTVLNRMVRPRSSTVSHTNGHHATPPPARQGSSAHNSPKMCRSLHASPRQRARSAVEPRGLHHTLQHVHSHHHRHSLRKPFGHEPTSSDEDSEMSASKLETIRHRAQERWQRKEVTPPTPAATPNTAAENAAVIIQRMWRGYHARNLNAEVQAVFRKIQDSRTQQYIQKLSDDMEATRAALENDRKLQVLKMQAINAIWKKVLTMQPANEKEEAACTSQKTDTEAIRELTQTCSMLHSQVEQLQGSMQSMLHCMSVLCQMPGLAPGAPTVQTTLATTTPATVPITVEPRATATQTDIVAVFTPQEEAVPFPYQRAVGGAASRARPSSLPIPQHRASGSAGHSNPEAPSEVKQFATSLVDGVLRTVAADTDGELVDSCVSDADTTAPTMEEIANGCVTSTEQEAQPSPQIEAVENESNDGNANIDIPEASETNENMMKSVLSFEENSADAVVDKESPVAATSPCEPASPNNNQRPQPNENGVLEL